MAHASVMESKTGYKCDIMISLQGTNSNCESIFKIFVLVWPIQLLATPGGRFQLKINYINRSSHQAWTKERMDRDFPRALACLDVKRWRSKKMFSMLICLQSLSHGDQQPFFFRESSSQLPSVFLASSFLSAFFFFDL